MVLERFLPPHKFLFSPDLPSSTSSYLLSPFRLGVNRGVLALRPLPSTRLPSAGPLTFPWRLNSLPPTGLVGPLEETSSWWAPSSLNLPGLPQHFPPSPFPSLLFCCQCLGVSGRREDRPFGFFFWLTALPGSRLSVQLPPTEIVRLSPSAHKTQRPIIWTL